LSEAINSDASVSGLKGTGRPIVDERERARVLAALDAVGIFGEPTPFELVLVVRPDVIVKGGNYEVGSIGVLQFHPATQQPEIAHARSGILQPPARVPGSLNRKTELPLKNQQKLSKQTEPPQL
jgi:hypothetical protein